MDSHLTQVLVENQDILKKRRVIVVDLHC